MAPSATTTTTTTSRRRPTVSFSDEEPKKLALAPSAEPVYPDIQTIRDAIPPHCFQPSALRSLGYLARDTLLITALGYAGLTYIPLLESTPVRWAAWIAYGYLQGLLCTGLWILAHECGHGAFSSHRLLNDIVGWTAHSALLVPYFSWKFSHHRHHRFTGHMEKDMAFVPQRKEDRARPRLANLYMDADLFEDVPIVQLAKLIAHQLAGWQMYLLFNVSAGQKSKQREGGWLRVSHFEPTSAVFRPGEAVFIFLSDLGLAIGSYLLYRAAGVVGWQTVFLLYGVPYFWVHHWLVAITYLHHNHPDVHHFDADNWTFVKGALATVDRDFGFVGRHLFHGIIDTHVVHHLFPRIPFYYAEEATEAIKPVVGDLYHRESRSFIGQLWETFTTCKYVEEDPAMPGVLKWAN
ncbi:fatty acid desaturase-domain-containing protein [Echria macrotheca]|uniref:Fatty acid desaturase-domain-containing protein n=1 Tax=Echria macrotheca TaxID=438768 RepID=A0AAJ0B424_9PEZI|nr:fatty acid desaturase-domain-containing protein [Echria macrotheca]